LVEIELPTPQPGPRDLLVSVRAASVNPVDVKRRRWEEPEDGSTHRILGYDAAGVVAAVGPEVTLIKPAMRCSTREQWIDPAAMQNFT
jgi:NADPH:quinone reductase-like Zn-dependent oxidoreductase